MARPSFRVVLLVSCVSSASCIKTGPLPADPNAALPEGAPVASQQAAVLASAGLQLANLPAMSALTRAQREAVMTTFNQSLGVDCEACHAASYSTETASMRVAREMWDEYSRGMTFSNGQPLYCDSCHQGKATFLARGDKDALEDFMQRAYADLLTPLSGAPKGCASCHGEPFVGGLVALWGEETGPTSDGGTVVDASIPPGGSDMGQADMAGTPPGDMAMPTVPCTVLLNEVQLGGTTATDEFIEIVNPCADPKVLDNYTLVYRSAAGVSDLSVVGLGTRTLAKNGFVVAANSGFAGAKDLSYTRALSGTGGAIALLDAAGVVVDVVSWGDATNAYVRGTPATAPASGQSVSRIPSGSPGVGNHALDFQVRTPTPGAAN